MTGYWEKVVPRFDSGAPPYKFYPVVVGTREANVVEVVDYPTFAERDELIIEAWERMTFGGARAWYHNRGTNPDIEHLACTVGGCYITVVSRAAR